MFYIDADARFVTVLLLTNENRLCIEQSSELFSDLAKISNEVYITGILFIFSEG
ncbi:MAG: hypothetical protein QXG40_07095 [Ignisphaera sp.]